jgi:hypothetical protein
MAVYRQSVRFPSGYSTGLVTGSQVKVKVILRLTVSQSVCLDVVPHLGHMTRNLFIGFNFQKVAVLSMWVPSLSRGRVCRFTRNWVSSIVFKITPRHGPQRNTSVSIVVVQLLQLPCNRLHNTVYNSNSIVVVACLPHRVIATVVVSFVSRCLPSNGSIRHNIIAFVLF